MPTEIERIEALEREVAELRAKVASMEAELGLIPGLVTTGFRQMDGRFARVLAEMTEFRAHIDDRFDATIRAVAEIVRGNGSEA